MCVITHEVVGCSIMVFDDFKEGNEYKQSEIFAAIGYQEDATTPRGILPVPKEDHTAIMLRLNLETSPYDDVYNPDSPVVYYIGEGQPEKGHQTYSHGNKTLAQGGDKDIHLFVHTEEEREGDWVYRGIWQLRGYEDSFVTKKKTPAGQLQRVFRFWLTKKTRPWFERGQILDMIAKTGALLKYEVYLRGAEAKSRSSLASKNLKTVEIPKQYRGFEQMENSDVIWFSDVPPLFMYNVLTDDEVDSALDGLHSVRHLDALLTVIGSEKHRSRFEALVSTEPYSSVKDRFSYCSAEEVVRLYQLALEFRRSKSTVLRYPVAEQDESK